MRRRRSKSGGRGGSSSDEDVNTNSKGDFELRVSSFRCSPDSLKVKINDRMVTVEGKAKADVDR